MHRVFCTNIPEAGKMAHILETVHKRVRQAHPVVDSARGSDFPLHRRSARDPDGVKPRKSDNRQDVYRIYGERKSYS